MFEGIILYIYIFIGMFGTFLFGLSVGYKLGAKSDAENGSDENSENDVSIDPHQAFRAGVKFGKAYAINAIQQEVNEGDSNE